MPARMIFNQPKYTVTRRSGCWYDDSDEPSVLKYLNAKPQKEQEKQPHRGVSFGSAMTTKVYETLHVYDYTEEEKQATWYTQKEVAAIRRDMKDTILYIETFGIETLMGRNDREDEFCVRGLEHRTSATSRQRCNTRQKATLAVMQEQYKQRCMEDYDPDYISYVYKAQSHQSKLKALEYAQQDAKYCVKKQQQL